MPFRGDELLGWIEDRNGSPFVAIAALVRLPIASIGAAVLAIPWIYWFSIG